MHTEKIPVRITQTGQTMEVAVYDRIKGVSINLLSGDKP